MSSEKGKEPFYLDEIEMHFMRITAKCLHDFSKEVVWYSHNEKPPTHLSDDVIYLFYRDNHFERMEEPELEDLESFA
jgi:hypothetical protein